MLKNVTVTTSETVVKGRQWTVGVPDGMSNERIEELMRDMVDNWVLTLNEEVRDDDGLSVDIADAPLGTKNQDLTLTDGGLVNEDAILSALSTDRLQAELERRHAKGSDIIVV